MYQLLLKQRFKFAVRMIKRNIGAYLILIAIVPCILILQSMIQTTHGMDIAVFIPYGILCFLFMNLFGTIPRMRISPETYIWKIEKTYIWRVKKIGKSTVLTLCVALILFWAASLSSFRHLPISLFCSAGTFRKSFMSAEISPFLLRYLILKASSSSAFCAFIFSTSFSRALILSSISLTSNLYLWAKVRLSFETAIQMRKFFVIWTWLFFFWSVSMNGPKASGSFDIW